MGFNEGSDPIGQLKSIIDGDKGLTYKTEKNIIKKTFGILGVLTSPSAESLEAGGAKLHGWGDGRSWPEVIEDSGIENLSFFLADPGYGRSQEGSQVPEELNPGARLEKMEYLGKLFKRTESKFIQLLKEKARQR
jgi:hypothetical protein